MYWAFKKRRFNQEDGSWQASKAHTLYVRNHEDPAAAGSAPVRVLLYIMVVWCILQRLPEVFLTMSNALISSNLLPRGRVIITIKKIFYRKIVGFFNFPSWQQGTNLLHQDTPAVMWLSQGIVTMTCHRLKMLCCKVFYQSNKASRDKPSLYSNAMVLQAIVGVISY